MANEQTMAAFIAGIARMTNIIDPPNPADPYEDQHALYRLIDEARKLTAEFEAHAKEQEGLECYRAAARDKWACDGAIEIDPGATVSVSDDGGAYVQAWVWVYDEAAGVNREEEEGDAN